MTKECIKSAAGQELKLSVMKCCFCSEYCEWDEEIYVYVGDNLKRQVARCREILQENFGFKSISIGVPVGFLDGVIGSRLNDVCRIGFQYIEVNEYDIYYCIQSKYDSSYTAEYCFDRSI